MEKTIEQTVICFCWKAGFDTTKTFEMVQKVYGESALVQCIFSKLGVDS